MARKRSLDDGPQLRELIMEQASQLFYERGFGSTSIRDVAEAAQMSSSTMYHYFTNKQDLLHAIVVRFMTDFVAATTPLLEDASLSPTQRLLEVVRLHIEISDDRRPELLVGNPIRNALEPQQRSDAVRLQYEYQVAVRTMITEGCATGEFTCPDARIATLALLDMLNGIREWFVPGGQLDRDEIVRLYQELALKLLAP
jgi:AcrR family transcriptional regulator